MVSSTYTSRNQTSVLTQKLRYKHSFKLAHSGTLRPKGPRGLKPKHRPKPASRRNKETESDGPPKPPRPFSTYKWYVTTREQPRHPYGVRRRKSACRSRSMSRARLSNNQLSRPPLLPPPPPRPPPRRRKHHYSDRSTKTDQRPLTKLRTEQDKPDGTVSVKKEGGPDNSIPERKTSYITNKPKTKPKPKNLEINPNSLNRASVSNKRQLKTTNTDQAALNLWESSRSLCAVPKPKLKPRIKPRNSENNNTHPNPPGLDIHTTKAPYSQPTTQVIRRESTIVHRTPPLGLGLSFRRTSHYRHSTVFGPPGTSQYRQSTLVGSQRTNVHRHSVISRPQRTNSQSHSVISGPLRSSHKASTETSQEPDDGYCVPVQPAWTEQANTERSSDTSPQIPQDDKLREEAPYLNRVDRKIPQSSTHGPSESSKAVHGIDRTPSSPSRDKVNTGHRKPRVPNKPDFFYIRTSSARYDKSPLPSSLSTRINNKQSASDSNGSNGRNTRNGYRQPPPLPPRELYSFVDRPLKCRSVAEGRSNDEIPNSGPRTPPLPPRTFTSSLRKSNHSSECVHRNSHVWSEISDYQDVDTMEYLEPAPVIHQLCLPRKKHKKHRHRARPFAYFVKAIRSCVGISCLYYRLRKAWRRNTSQYVFNNSDHGD